MCFKNDIHLSDRHFLYCVICKKSIKICDEKQFLLHKLYIYFRINLYKCKKIRFYVCEIIFIVEIY